MRLFDAGTSARKENMTVEKLKTHLHLHIWEMGFEFLRRHLFASHLCMRSESRYVNLQRRRDGHQCFRV